MAEVGEAAWVERQLAAAEDDDPALLARLHRIDALRMDGMELLDLPMAELVRQLQQAATLRAVYSRHQLRERLVDLWSNHFNIYARKGNAMYLLAADTAKVIRHHALGKFPDMVRASARSPAMLGYLDNQVNRKGVANENYARELLELHTLGVDGGYTQRDVQEVARCLTGWTIENRFLRPRGRFRFDPDAHDDGEKVVLGQRIPSGGGESDGDRVLAILCSHPATARFIAGKICRSFLGGAADRWIDRTAEVFSETGGDIAAMVKPILLSTDLLESPPILKRPFDYVVSALRASNAVTDANRPLLAHIEAMGQPLYEWPMPDGYPDSTEAWTGSLLARWNFAFALADGAISGTAADAADLADHGASLTEVVTGRTGVAMRGTTPAHGLAMTLCSPEFMWR
jgi:uncharacterized protein (DUF1800 family)